MKQPRVFARSMVIDAAFDILREQGWKGVTARSIAKRLGSSTMPIYSHMKSLETLEQELRGKTHQLLQEYQKRKYTDDALLNMAVGYIAFARDEGQLFRYLFIESPKTGSTASISNFKDAFEQSYSSDSNQADMLNEMDDSAQEGLIRNTYIYTHGLAMLVNSGVMGSWSDELIHRCLTDAGQAFYMLEIGREQQ